MKAKIKTENKVYDAELFAVIDKVWGTQTVAFDEDMKTLRLIDYFEKINNSLMKKVVWVETKCKGWVKRGKISGYKWFLDACTDFEHLENLPAEILEKCKEVQSACKIREWNLLKSQRSLDKLLGVSISFHDSFVEKLEKKGDKAFLTLNTTWGYRVNLILEGEVELNVELNYGRKGEIFHANMFIEDDKIYWVNGWIKSKAEFLPTEKYFCAKKMKWSIEVV